MRPVILVSMSGHRYKMRALTGVSDELWDEFDAAAKKVGLANRAAYLRNFINYVTGHDDLAPPVPWEKAGPSAPTNRELRAIERETRPPAEVLDRAPTFWDVRRWPNYFLEGEGYLVAQATECLHGYYLTDSCPGCDMVEEWERESAHAWGLFVELVSDYEEGHPDVSTVDANWAVLRAYRPDLAAEAEPGSSSTTLRRFVRDRLMAEDPNWFEKVSE